MSVHGHHRPARICAAPTPPPPTQKDDSDKPISDQWLDPFVIVGEDNNPVGTIQDGKAGWHQGSWWVPPALAVEGEGMRVRAFIPSHRTG